MSKTLFITGSSSGIGLAAVKLFYGTGWNVVATMRTPEKIPELESLDTSRVLIQRLDLLDFGTIQPAVDAAIVKFGKIDLLVNNAGYGQNGLFETIPLEKVEEQFKVNLFGAMEVTRAILPHFRSNGGGGVINVSSGGGLYTLPMMSIYCSSKFALEGFTESLSYELASQNIFVKSVIPHGGVTETRFVATSSEKAPQDISTVPSYGPFIAKTMEGYKNMVAGISITSSDVAQVILGAATDGSDRLRYLVGNDTRGFIKARYGSKDDEEYMTFMRSFFNK